MGDEDDLPNDLKYMASLVRACNEFGTRDEMYAFVAGMTDAQKQRWRDVCNEIREKNHAADIEEVKRSSPNRRLALLLVRFSSVCDVLDGITEEERIRRLLESPPDYGTPDWTQLPVGFEYLAEPAERFGLFLSEETQCHQIDRFSEHDFQELQDLAARMHADNGSDVLGKWFDEGLDDYSTRRELQMVESLISVMTLCGISYE